MKFLQILIIFTFCSLSMSVSLFGPDSEELKEICSTDIDGKNRNPPLVTQQECFDRKFCPLFQGMKKSHRLVLVDTSGKLSENEIGFLKNDVLSRQTLTNDVSPYTKVTVVDLNDKFTPSNIKPLAAHCRPRAGNAGTPFAADAPHSSQGVNFTKKRFQAWGGKVSSGPIKILSSQSAAKESLIFEHIRAVTNFPIFDFTEGDFEERTLVLFSDLLQNSEKFKLARDCRKLGMARNSCSDFITFFDSVSNAQRNYLEKQKPSFSDNTKIIIYQIINKQVSQRFEKDLESFYKSYFKWAGIKSENIEHILLFDQ